MKIGGFQKFSMLDYPGKTAAIVFTQGCNFKCPFCHNPELVLPPLFTSPIPVNEVLTRLKKRKGLLEGVVISGGEPTIHNELPGFIRLVKEMGFSVKLDTNGSNPSMLAGLLRGKMLDFVAMDIKTSFDKYPILAGTEVNTGNIKNSVDIILRSGVPHQFRTTLVPSLHAVSDVSSLYKWGEDKGLKIVFQEFKPDKVLTPGFLKENNGENKKERICDQRLG